METKTKTQPHMNIHTERWYVRGDGKGTYEARFELADNGVVNGSGAARSGLSLDEAVAHCAMAIRTTAEREEKSALIDGMLDKTNWKLPTARVTVATVAEARRIREALDYFCGGSEVHPAKGGGIDVGSLGYYHYVGA
jgi:hypothetical protein